MVAAFNSVKANVGYRKKGAIPEPEDRSSKYCWYCTGSEVNQAGNPVANCSAMAVLAAAGFVKARD